MKNLIFDSFESAPPAHDKWVVCSQDSNHIDSLGFELAILLDVRRQVVCVAGGLSENKDDQSQPHAVANMSELHSR